MDDHIRKLDTKIQSKETELNALFTKIQKLEEEIATLYHKKLISKKLETAEMTLTSVLGEKQRKRKSQLPASPKWVRWVGVVKRHLNIMTQEGNKLRQLC